MTGKSGVLKLIITKQLKISFIVILYLLVLYTLLRTGFYINNISSFADAFFGEIFFSFIKGLRFDIAAIFITNLLVLLLYNFPYAPIQEKWYKVLVLIIFFIINLTVLFTNIADYGYYETTQRRLMYEPYTMFGDIQVAFTQDFGVALFLEDFSLNIYHTERRIMQG